MKWFGAKEPEVANVPEPRLTIERSLNELQIKTGTHDRVWGLGDASWGADIAGGVLTFENAAGQTITAPLQVVGTYNVDEQSWLWGWDHPSVPPSAAKAALQALQFGRRYGLTEYTTRNIVCTEEKAWEFAAVACHLAGAQGAYRGPAGPTLVFMTFGQVSISKNR